MIVEYAVTFERHGSHGKETELTVHHEMIVDAVPMYLDDVVKFAWSYATDLIKKEQQGRWTLAGARRVRP